MIHKSNLAWDNVGEIPTIEDLQYTIKSLREEQGSKTWNEVRDFLKREFPKAWELLKVRGTLCICERWYRIKYENKSLSLGFRSRSAPNQSPYPSTFWDSDLPRHLLPEPPNSSFRSFPRSVPSHLPLDLLPPGEEIDTRHLLPPGSVAELGGYPYRAKRTGFERGGYHTNAQARTLNRNRRPSRGLDALREEYLGKPLGDEFYRDRDPYYYYSRSLQRSREIAHRRIIDIPEGSNLAPCSESLGSGVVKRWSSKSEKSPTDQEREWSYFALSRGWSGSSNVVEGRPKNKGLDRRIDEKEKWEREKILYGANRQSEESGRKLAAVHDPPPGYVFSSQKREGFVDCEEILSGISPAKEIAGKRIPPPPPPRPKNNEARPKKIDTTALIISPPKTKKEGVWGNNSILPKALKSPRRGTWVKDRELTKPQLKIVTPVIEPKKQQKATTKAAQTTPPSRMSWNNSVYITGLGNRTDVTEQQLFDALLPFGELDSVRIMNKESDSYAFANFKTPAGLQSCVWSSGQVFVGGHALSMRPKRCGFPVEPAAGSKSVSTGVEEKTEGQVASSRDDEIYSPALNARTRTKDVWVGSLPQGVSEVRLLKLISSISGLKPVRLKPHGNGNTRSVFVEYESTAKAQLAVARLNNAECGGTLLRSHMCFKWSPWYIDRASKLQKLQSILSSRFTKRELEKIDDKLRSIWCAGFPPNTPIEMIYKSFSKFGEIDMVSIQHDRKTHKRTGSCFIRYRDYKTVPAVLKAWEFHSDGFSSVSLDKVLKSLKGVNRAFQPSFLDGKPIALGFAVSSCAPTRKYKEVVYGE